MDQKIILKYFDSKNYFELFKKKTLLKKYFSEFFSSGFLGQKIFLIIFENFFGLKNIFKIFYISFLNKKLLRNIFIYLLGLKFFFQFISRASSSSLFFLSVGPLPSPNILYWLPPPLLGPEHIKRR